MVEHRESVGAYTQAVGRIKGVLSFCYAVADITVHL